MASRLVNMFVKNVAAVDKAANRRRFLVIKAEGATTFDEAMIGRRVHKVYEALGERYGALMETMESISRNENSSPYAIRSAIKAALGDFIESMSKAMPSLLSELGEDVEKAGRRISAGRMAKLKTLQKVLNEIITEGEKDMSDNKPDVGMLTKMGHGIAALFARASGADDATIANLEKAARGEDPNAVVTDPEVTTRLTKAEAEATALKKSNEELAKQVTKLQEEADLRKFAEEISGFNKLGLDPVKDAALLKSVEEKAGKESADRLREIFKAANAQANVANLFGEVGSSHPGSATVTAAEEVVQKMAELIKADDTLSKSDARDMVFTTNPDLYDRWRAETTVKV